MKTFIRRFFKWFGFEITRYIKSPEDITYPYVETFNKGKISFKYWITDKTYRNWYDPAGHAAWHETEGYLDLVSANDKVLEIGCNNGFTMCLLKSITGPDAPFVGLDIVPFNCQIACSQIGLNSLHNCQVLNVAASDRDETLQVAVTHNGRVAQQDLGFETVEVNAIKCDNLIQEHGYFDLVKIDVEGFEAKVLKGCQELLAHRPKLILEIHGPDLERYGSTVEEVLDLIGIDNYEGSMCLRDENLTRELDRQLLLAEKPNVTLFLKSSS